MWHGTTHQYIRTRKRDQHPEGHLQSGGCYQRLQADPETRGSRPADLCRLYVTQGRRGGRGKYGNVKLGRGFPEIDSPAAGFNQLEITQQRFYGS